MKITTPVVLASASPRRKELIQFVFSNVRVCASNTSEEIADSISCDEVAAHLAKQKAQAVSLQFPDEFVIGSDTVVLCGDEILTKPVDERDAVRILKRLSGKRHRVCTGCAIVYKGKTHTFCEFTQVAFWDLDDALIERYVASREPLDKAGAYGIQGMGSLLVQEIHGDYFNVVGLPISRLYREFSAFLKQNRDE